MHPLMTDNQIIEMLKDADNVIITGESNHKEIGIRIGEFSMTASINDNLRPENQRDAITIIIRELRALNRQQTFQKQAAARKAQRES